MGAAARNERGFFGHSFFGLPSMPDTRFGHGPALFFQASPSILGDRNPTFDVRTLVRKPGDTDSRRAIISYLRAGNAAAETVNIETNNEFGRAEIIIPAYEKLPIVVRTADQRRSYVLTIDSQHDSPKIIERKRGMVALIEELKQELDMNLAIRQYQQEGLPPGIVRIFPNRRLGRRETDFIPEEREALETIRAVLELRFPSF